MVPRTFLTIHHKPSYFNLGFIFLRGVSAFHSQESTLNSHCLFRFQCNLIVFVIDKRGNLPVLVPAGPSSASSSVKIFHIKHHSADGIKNSAQVGQESNLIVCHPQKTRRRKKKNKKHLFRERNPSQDSLGSLTSPNNSNNSKENTRKPRWNRSQCPCHVFKLDRIQYIYTAVRKYNLNAAVVILVYVATFSFCFDFLSCRHPPGRLVLSILVTFS